MKQGGIRIVATIEGWLPVGDCEFDITVSKGVMEYSLRFYGNVNDWKAFGKRLITFPLSTTDEVWLELGSQGSSAYLVFNAYCYDEKGHAALGILMSKDECEPYRFRLEFSIPAEAASINQFGQFLMNWQVENGSEIVWEAQTS